MEHKENELTSFYIYTLQKANTSRETYEGNNLFYLAFFGLIRSGYPYEITEEIIPEEEPIIKPKHRSSKKKNEEEDKPTEIKTKRVVTIRIGKKGYVCDETELINIFGDSYNALVYATPEHQDTLKTDENNIFILPNAYAEDKEEDDRPKQTVEEKKEQAKPRIPYIKSDTRYPDDKLGCKEYDSFLFNIHNIKVMFDDGRQILCTATVYPLSMEDADTLSAPVFCIITDEQGRTRCSMSDVISKAGNSVTAEFDDFSLVIRGRWQGGEFMSTCGIYSVMDGMQAYIDEKVTKVKPTNRTSAFYLRYYGKNGNILNVFPVALLRNDPKTGLAQSVVMIEDGTSRKIYSGEDNRTLSLWFDNAQKLISVFWAGNALNIHVDDEEG